MAAVFCHIGMDRLQDGKPVFLVRVFKSEADLAKGKKPLDVWEAYGLQVDSDTLLYLEDKMTEEDVWDHLSQIPWEE
jgi:hypothetical protein